MLIMKNSDSKVKSIINQLQKEQIVTWFDLGLFLDRIKENRQDARTGFKKLSIWSDKKLRY